MVAGSLKGGETVAYRSEVQERWNGFLGWRDGGAVWVIGGGEDAIIDFAIALDDVGALGLSQAIDLVDVAADGVGEIGEVEGA